MKNIKVLMLAVAGVFTLGLSSCVNDLDVTPIDPNTHTLHKPFCRLVFRPVMNMMQNTAP